VTWTVNYFQKSSTFKKIRMPWDFSRLIRDKKTGERSPAWRFRCFTPGLKKKTPAYAVLTTFLNLLKKWVPTIVASGVLLPALQVNQQTGSPQTSKGPGSKVLAQKTNANHAHRRG
jgi:hypothetical protein